MKFPLAILLLTCSLAHAQAIDSAVPTQAGRAPVKLLPTLAPPAKLIGDLSDPVWKSAADFPLRNAFTGQPLLLHTTAKAFATADSIYVGFSCDEPDMNSLVTEGPVWARDSVEVFLQQGMDLKLRPYHEIEIDSRGTADFRCQHIYPYPKYFNLKYAVQPWDPKLDIATARTAKGWTVELCIPFSQLHLDDAQKSSYVWRMDFHRNRPSRNDSSAMYWGWAPTGIKTFHMAGRFGIVLIDLDNMLSIDDLNLPPATEQDKKWLAPMDDALAKDIDQAATALLDGDATAVDHLQSLSRENVGAAIMIQQKLLPLGRLGPKPPEVLTRIQTVLANCQLLPLQNDDDPPPAEIQGRIDAFEPRTYRDATGMTLGYRLLKPATIDRAKKYPALLFLHGAGESGTDNRRQLADGSLVFSSTEYLDKYPCFLIAPQCPATDSWMNIEAKHPENQQAGPFRFKDKPTDSLRMAMEITDALQKEFPSIDPTRIYISGAAQGGMGTYEAVYRRPRYFAAAAPIAGDGDPDTAPALAGTPFFIFHGARDDRTSPQGDLDMFTAIQKAGGNAGLLVYYKGHQAILATSDPTYLDWLFAQQRTPDKSNP